MSIFNKGKLSKQQLVSKLILFAISLLALGFSWDIEFPGDQRATDGSLDFSAMHIIFNTIALIGAFIYLVILLRKSLDQSLEWDFEADVASDTNYYADVKTLVLFLAIFIIGTKVFSDSKEIYNLTVQYTNEYIKIAQEKETYYDNMTKTNFFKDNILERNKSTFIEVTKILMDGRKDSGKIAWKWVQENQPVPYSEFTKFYADLSEFIESQRAGYLEIELKSQEIAKSNNTLLELFPNNIYNLFLNRPKINYKPGFTSTKTSKVFQTGIENVE